MGVLYSLIFAKDTATLSVVDNEMVGCSLALPWVALKVKFLHTGLSLSSTVNEIDLEQLSDKLLQSPGAQLRQEWVQVTNPGAVLVQDFVPQKVPLQLTAPDGVPDPTQLS